MNATKSTTLQVRLYPCDKAKLRQLAEKAGISVSEWISRAITRAKLN